MENLFSASQGFSKHAVGGRGEPKKERKRIRLQQRNLFENDSSFSFNFSSALLF